MAKPLAMQRADAQRNRARIVEAAIEQLGRDPATSMGDIAEAAGVGRNTLYGHFPTRADLIEAALDTAIQQGDAVLEGVDLGGDASAALGRLIESSWVIVARSRSLLEAAEGVVGPAKIKALHAGPMDRVLRLLARGRADGAFRDDLPIEWLAAVMHSVMHGAATEVTAGRIDSESAAELITRTLLPAFAASSRT
ncbi:TetR/AcrR family transcriptional regulator [Intrasporangium sp.]|uniref:TetR/AcrR family transcriptional regulator n=1 Tax=Intrasporangium sp. TaxID=1925024 RepID=UPI00293A8594|nr:TetR/AcrR family transcriptional regulator [Intrasporangium sp.]MDV3220855.1 TetR/AcrR family transcriptional regulator [Intrasporangium sp.]